MSRPLLGLILVNHDSFGKIQESLCSAQPQDKQAQLAKVFFVDKRGTVLLKFLEEHYRTFHNVL